VYPRGRVALERALSKRGLASRSEARRLIHDGAVTVNGRAETNPLAAVHPERDRIEVGGRPPSARTWRTIAFYKPRGVMTTRRDPQGRTTVFDVLGAAGEGLVAVGRLDFATAGLLLLTTDTQLAERLTHPRHAVAVRKRSRRETHLLVELTEGKNREIRRLFDAIGRPVTKLLRVAYGPIELGRLQPGEWREISRAEVARL